MQHQRTRRQSRGQSLVEAALTLPVLVLLMVGLLDFGRVYYTVVALRDAADEGAVYAAMNPNDLNGIRMRAVDASPALVTINPANVQRFAPTLQVGQPITVTVTFDLELYTPLATTFVGGGILQLRGQSTQSIINP